MPEPAKRDIKIYAGDSFALKVRLKNPKYDPADPSQGPQYLDVTGCTAKAQIRSVDTATEPLAEFAVVVGSSDGSFTLTLGPGTTAALTEGGVWDLQVTWPDGSVRTYLRGKASVKRDVTRG